MALYNQFIFIGFEIFVNQWCLMNMIYFSLALSLAVILFKTYKYEGIGLATDQDHVRQICKLRVVEAFLSVLIWNKSIYFMTLDNKMVPLIAIIFKILKEITYFVVVLVIFMFAFSLSFFLIGKN